MVGTSSPICLFRLRLAATWLSRGKFFAKVHVSEKKVFPDKMVLLQQEWDLCQRLARLMGQPLRAYREDK